MKHFEIVEVKGRLTVRRVSNKPTLAQQQAVWDYRCRMIGQRRIRKAEKKDRRAYARALNKQNRRVNALLKARI